MKRVTSKTLYVKRIGNFMNSFASTPQVKINKYLVDI